MWIVTAERNSVGGPSRGGLDRRWFLVRHQDPKIHELAEVGAGEDDAALAGNRVARVRGRPPIEELKCTNQTLRDMKRVEVAVGPQGGPLRRCLNDFIATETQDL